MSAAAHPLVREAARQGRIELTDRGLGWTAWFELPGDAAAAVAGVAAATQLHQHLQAARGGVAPREGLEAFGVAFAARAGSGLSWIGAPVGLVGACGGLGVACWASDPAAPRGHVRLTLPRALPGDPRVVREARFGWAERFSATLSGRPELELGDEVFDQRFAVRSLRPEVLSEVLTPAVRAALSALDTHLPATLGASGVEAVGPLAPAGVDGVVSAAVALAHALGEV